MAEYGQKSVFISYAREDASYAHALYLELKASGFDPWMDKPPPPYQNDGLKHGQRWKSVIRSRLKASDLIVLILSRVSVAKRGVVRYEFRLALELMAELPDEDVLVVPVRVDDCRVPDLTVSTISLTDLDWADARKEEIPQLVSNLSAQLGQIL